MNNPHLLLVLQTHSIGNSAGDVERFCKAPKKEVMRRCTKSLIDSVNYAVNLLPNFTFELKVFDDHSDSESIENLKTNLNTANFKTNLESLNSRGIMPSILACYEYGKAHGKDWVYFVQDDYLYEETAIYDMLGVAIQTTQNLGKYTCVFPYNDPYRYDPVNTVILSHIIQMQGRHWRTQIMTGSCFMVHHSILMKEWDVFEAMGKHEITTDMEDKTINQLFRSRGYYLFVPIPSLALHMQYEREKDPFIDWREWWDRYKPSNLLQLDKSKQNLLHIDFKNQDLKEDKNATDLTGYNIITLEDISAKITDLSTIPSDSFDVIYVNHALEYIEFNEVAIALKEFNRILKTNGFVRFIVFDIQAVAMHLLQDKLLENIYVFHDVSKEKIKPYQILYPQNDHKIGFTKNIIDSISEKINIPVKIEKTNRELIISFKKT